MNSDTKTASMKRLARIEGQVRGVSKMISEDRYCIDVIRQVQAIKAALTGLEKVVLEDHINSCVETALASEEFATRREKVEELVAVLSGNKR